jgi:hypothetical protein
MRADDVSHLVASFVVNSTTETRRSVQAWIAWVTDWLEDLAWIAVLFGIAFPTLVAPPVLRILMVGALVLLVFRAAISHKLPEYEQSRARPPWWLSLGLSVVGIVAAGMAVVLGSGWLWLAILLLIAYVFTAASHVMRASGNSQ